MSSTTITTLPTQTRVTTAGAASAAVGAAVPRQATGLRHADRTREERRTTSARLLREAADAADERDRRRLLDEVVVLNLGLARAIASRYRRRGIGHEDLEQVANLALVKAANGFDPDSGHDFASYAVPTIRGEVKRYFRDHGWTVRPPRRIQELQARIGAAESELSFALGRSPRPSELARHLDEPVEEVMEALSTDGCFTPSSLDRPVGGESDTTLGDLLGAEQSTDAVEARVVLAPVVRRLGERDRRILMLRFFRGWTQSEIARDIGVTQMQVSRLLSRILAELRDELAQQDLFASDSGSS
jgi:RNA polymerase sigma-B factor